MKRLHRLRAEQYCWIFVKAALVLLGCFYITNPDFSPMRSLGDVFNILASGFVIVGGVTSIFGITISGVSWGKKRVNGLFIDILGLILLACGSSVYFVSQLTLALGGDYDFRRKVSGVLFGFILTNIFAGRVILKRSIIKEGW